MYLSANSEIMSIFGHWSSISFWMPHSSSTSSSAAERVWIFPLSSLATRSLKSWTFLPITMISEHNSFWLLTVLTEDDSAKLHHEFRGCQLDLLSSAAHGILNFEYRIFVAVFSRQTQWKESKQVFKIRHDQIDELPVTYIRQKHIPALSKVASFLQIWPANCTGGNTKYKYTLILLQIHEIQAVWNMLHSNWHLLTRIWNILPKSSKI